MQLTIVTLILIVAVALSIKHFHKMFTAKDKRCVGCPLKEACDKNKAECDKCKSCQ